MQHLLERRRRLHDHSSFGERASGAVARIVGSWRFVLIQAAIMVFWIATGGFRHDLFPFILLNLMLSTQAGFTGPILQMAANRQEAINQRRDDHEAEEVAVIHGLLENNTTLTREVHAINRRQTRLLHLFADHLGVPLPPLDDELEEVPDAA